MSGRQVWDFGSTRSRVYWTLRMAPQGLVWRDLVQAAGVSAKAADYALVELLKSGFIVHSDGKGSPYLASANQSPPYELEALGRNLMWCLQDYPGGITRKLLAQDAVVSEAEVYFGLQAGLLAGKAVQRWLPNVEAIDREIGYQLRADMPDEAVHQVVQVAEAGHLPDVAFSLAGKHADFALQTDGQVSVCWDGGKAQALLPGQVVREFFAFMAEASLTAARGR